jgi:hypothetical protein
MNWLLCRSFQHMIVGMVLLVVATSAFGGDDSPGPTQSLEDEELLVLAAAVQQLHIGGSPHWFLLADHTVSFRCESAATTGFSVGDCSGMRSHDQNPAEILGWVRETIRPVTKALTDSLAMRAAASVPVNRPLPLETRQVIWGPTRGVGPGSIPDGLGSPDFALYPSRVGFNAGRDAALLYLGVVNWSDSSKSFGEYVYLVKANTRWDVNGRARVWQLGP